MRKTDTTMDRLFGCEFRYVEWVIVTWATLWGVWLIFVVDMTREAYTYMRNIVEFVSLHPELTPFVWGGSLWVMGLTLAYGLIQNRLAYRKTALFFLTIYWLGVALTLGLQNFYSTAFATYVPLACLVLLAFLRLANRRV